MKELTISCTSDEKDCAKHTEQKIGNGKEKIKKISFLVNAVGNSKQENYPSATKAK